jgi:hypothetical protein
MNISVLKKKTEKKTRIMEKPKVARISENSETEILPFLFKSKSSNACLTLSFLL